MVLVNLTSECIECREKGGCPMVIIHRFTELQRLICRFPLEQCKDHSFLQRLYPRSKQNQDITSLHSPSHPQSTITSCNSHCSQLGSTAKSKTRKRSNNFLGICSYFDLLSCCGKRGGEKEEKSGKEGATNGTPSFGQGIHARWSAKENEKNSRKKQANWGSDNIEETYAKLPNSVFATKWFSQRTFCIYAKFRALCKALPKNMTVKKEQKPKRKGKGKRGTIERASKL